jgi:hypothetical protein
LRPIDQTATGSTRQQEPADPITPLTGEEESKRVRRLAPAFVSPQAFRAATLAASGYGGARQARRECRLGDQAEADRLAQLRSIAATMLSANSSGRERNG